MLLMSVRNWTEMNGGFKIRLPFLIEATKAHRQEITYPRAQIRQSSENPIIRLVS